MRALHNSRESAYRRPFGALLRSNTATLSIDIWDDPNARCYLRTWMDDVGEARIPMMGAPNGDHLTFTCDIAPDQLGNLWYCFVIESSDESTWFYGAKEGRTGGEGQLYDHMPPSFQITVYRKRAMNPDWFKNGLVYQIFPDRFKRGEGWLERDREVLSHPKHGIARALVQDWETPVAYEKDADGRIVRWDFYGGDLNGIREELPRLAELGITALYLNPIFAASSNHRYDTADYLEIDPLLGTQADFVQLVQAADELGISIILDGVFNHTGADSRYFDKYGNYEVQGAWQSKDSPYFDWFLLDEDRTYRCWWGVDDLPDTNKDNEGWQSFVYGPGGVVEHWLRLGARGWRLDVADELNDNFIAGIKIAETRVKPDALLLGEVWEDASNKIAYGEMRHYLNGNELDSVMNYPFREALINYLTFAWPAEEMAERMATLKENYPPPAFATTLNLLGSHDRARLFTILGGAPRPETLTDEQRRTYRLSVSQRGLAKGRFWLAMLVLMSSPGVPCIYYGDEAGVEGYTDPYNRGPYPWGHEDQDAMTMVRNAIRLRQRFDFLINGDFEPFSEGRDVYGFWRTSVRENSNPNGPNAHTPAEGAVDLTSSFTIPGTVSTRPFQVPEPTAQRQECACILVNRSQSESHEVRLPKRGPQVDDLITGRPVREDGDEVVVTLYPFGSSFLYFHDQSPLVRPLERGSGIVCHITSVPNGNRPGTLGEPSRRFVDYLAETGQRYWQVLPVTPPDSYGSPYAGSSAFAGNPALIETDDHSLAELFQQFQPDDDFRQFETTHRDWLEPYATYMAVKDLLGDEMVWQDWPKRYHRFSPELQNDPDLESRALFHKFCQYLFQLQWDELRAYANDRGVKIIGDIPIYVSEDSSDTWSSPQMFQLNEAGHVSQTAGTPPDQFAPQGQAWGNPTYNWKAMDADGFEWWIQRLGRAFELYDMVRVDHFLGFEQFYSIPEGKSPSEGQWMKGPGIKVFEQAFKRFGQLPIIAEDLGTITPSIRALVAQCGFPAMDVLEFFDGDVRYGYYPHPKKVVYTSTHDTDTLLGWVCKSFFPEYRADVFGGAMGVGSGTADNASNENGAGGPSGTSCDTSNVNGVEGTTGDVDGSNSDSIASGNDASEFDANVSSGFTGDASEGFGDGADGMDGNASFDQAESKHSMSAYELQRQAELLQEAKELANRLIQESLATDNTLVMMPLQDVLSLGSDCRMNVPGVASGNWTWQAREADVQASIPKLREWTRAAGR